MSLLQLFLIGFTIFTMTVLSLPVWVLFHCELYSQMPLPEKLRWAMKMSRTWSINHYFFVLGAAKDRLVLWVLIVVVAPISVVLLIYAQNIKAEFEPEREKLEQVYSTFEITDFSGLTPEEKFYFDETIEEMRVTLVDRWFVRGEKLEVAKHLETLKGLLGDWAITLGEYQSWMQVMNPDVLKEEESARASGKGKSFAGGALNKIKKAQEETAMLQSEDPEKPGWMSQAGKGKRDQGAFGKGYEAGKALAGGRTPKPKGEKKIRPQPPAKPRPKPLKGKAPARKPAPPPAKKIIPKLSDLDQRLQLLIKYHLSIPIYHIQATLRVGLLFVQDNQELVQEKCDAVKNFFLSFWQAWKYRDLLRN